MLGLTRLQEICDGINHNYQQTMAKTHARYFVLL